MMRDLFAIAKFCYYLDGHQGFSLPRHLLQSPDSGFI